jgi:hypothetical protein
MDVNLGSAISFLTIGLWKLLQQKLICFVAGEHERARCGALTEAGKLALKPM